MATEIDGLLVQWGDRLFYSRNRRNGSTSSPRLSSGQRHRAAEIRQRINATVVRRAAQVMVKVTGGGRGMAAICAHLRYISRRGDLEFEDERGVVREGKEALHDLAEQWRYGGSFIDETSHRRLMYRRCAPIAAMPLPPPVTLTITWAARRTTVALMRWRISAAR